ncbi:MAG TPA: hypothetical protein PK511_05290 [Chitinophagales bacterium]|nr:hypothetical protein [Chitinophagales bacterium]HMZ88648.1 hypothetical protein [Chitinophagales bacterium]HNA57037.1 hypothetical protein [Chitinophagales bacterium]HNE46386.1 hypothetical protein [Chitinophagales bacterium]HNF69633.1 hypothetical protein [Chitinophagales bacterium]
MRRIKLLLIAFVSIISLRAQPELEFCRVAPIVYFDSVDNKPMLNLPVGGKWIDSLEFSLNGNYKNSFVSVDIGVQGSGAEILRESDSLWRISLFAYFDFSSDSDTAQEIEVARLILTKNEAGYICKTDLSFRPDPVELKGEQLHNLFSSCANNNLYKLSAFDIGESEWDTLSLLINDLFVLSLHGDALALKEFNDMLILFPAVKMYELHHYYMSARAVLCLYGMK